MVTGWWADGPASYPCFGVTGPQSVSREPGGGQVRSAPPGGQSQILMLVPGSLCARRTQREGLPCPNVEPRAECPLSSLPWPLCR